MPRLEPLHYQNLDKRVEGMAYIPEARNNRFLTFKRIHPRTLLSIFKFFVTPALLGKIIENMDDDHFILNRRRNYIHRPSITEIYMALAVMIRIQGIHNAPQESTKNRRPLTEAVEEARNHFQHLVPSTHMPGMDIMMKLISLELFTSEYSEEISQNFQNLVFSMGSICAGDEKLFHYTGKTKDIRFVPSKPARIGLWFYELAVPLSYGAQYLLHTRLSLGKEGLPVSSIVKIWCNIIKSYPNDHPMLLFDSYYMDNTAKVVLEESGVSYLASFNPHRFQVITPLLEAEVKKEGEWACLYEPESHHSIVHYWSPNKSMGKKWVMGNACTKTRYPNQRGNVPLYDDYGKNYAACDHYNRSLYEKSWPHKKGGRKRMGALGAQQNFIFTCILVNTINAFNEMEKRGHENFDYRRYCVDLADELFRSTS